MLAESATRSITRVGHLWLDDFRCLQRHRPRARSRAHGDPRRERAGQDEHARSDRVDRAGALVPRRERRAARAQRVRAGDRARRDRRATTGCSSSRPSSARAGRNRVQCNKPAGHARARSARAAARRGVRARRPRAGEGRPGRAPRCTSTSCSAMLAVRYDAARADFERVLKQRNALLRSGVRDDVGDGDPRRARRAAGARGGRAGARPAATRRPARPGGQRGVRRRWPTTAGPSPRRYEAEWAPEPLGDRPTPTRSRSCCATALVARRRAEIDRGRDARRSAPRRLEARRSTGSTRAPRRRRASSAASRSRCGSPAAASCTSSPARRRCCCSTTCSASSTRSRSSALVRNLPPGQTLLTTAGVIPPDVAARSACCGSTRAGSRQRMSESRMTRRDEPVLLRDAVAAVGRELGMPPPDAFATLAARVARRSSATQLARARDGAFGARRRVHGRGRRTGLGDPAAVRRAPARGARERVLRTGCRDLDSGGRRTGPGTAVSVAPGSGTLVRPETPPLTRPFACRNGVSAAR